MSDVSIEGAEAAPAPSGRSKAFYFAAWRWHFYAGIFVIPFLLMLAITGGVMMIYSSIGNELGQAPSVEATGTPLPTLQLAAAAALTVPDGSLTQYVAPESPTRPAYFQFTQGDATLSVAVNPYTAEVLATIDQSKTILALAESIHGTLLIGDTGDLLIEAAASLTILLIVTGIYLWLPRSASGVFKALAPNLKLKGRALWRDLHKSVGLWISAFLVLFMLSGLAWAGIWGGKFVQPWSSFPAEKWDNVPLSDITHASMNHTAIHEVPWALEQTPMPASGSTAGTPAIPTPVNLDTVSAWATSNGFAGQYRISVPSTETGVYTVSIDGRNGDGFTPLDDRFVHIDQYSGNILADIGYADYSLMGQAMAMGIGLHKGQAGPLNFVFNLCYLALVIFLCVSGVVMWWKRRPSGTFRLAAPPVPANLPHWRGAVLVALAISLAFPMAGISLLVVLALDVLLISRLPVLRRAFS